MLSLVVFNREYWTQDALLVGATRRLLGCF
jgi:hypothetical protein